MFKGTKKVLCGLLAFAMLITMTPLTISAAGENYLVLGDSISTSTSLKEGEKNFTEIIAENRIYTVNNQAALQNEIADVRVQIETGELDEAIASAELITLTGGSMDMLKLAYKDVVNKYNAENSANLTQEDIINILTSGNIMSNLKLYLTALEVLKNFANSETFKNGLAAYEENLAAITAYIHEQNPDAIIVVPTQYNPYKSVSGAVYEVLNLVVGQCVVKLNAVINNKASAYGYIAADAYTAFNASSENLCNATEEPMNPDFHMNAQGHIVMAEVIESVLPSDELPFTDVKEDDWFYKFVKFVYKNEIMKGTKDTLFGPDGKLSRAQFATILYRMYGEPEVIYTDTFTDIPEGEWYSDAVLWANSAEVVRGVGGGRFAPDADITREEMAVMMFRYASLGGYDMTASEELSGFSDCDLVDDWAEEAMQWAVGSGLITGNADGTLNPRGNANRAECATIITRFMQM